MNILKDYTYAWWQIGLLKFAVLCFGLVVGAHWHEVFIEYTTILLLVGAVLALYLGVVSFKK